MKEFVSIKGKIGFPTFKYPISTHESLVYPPNRTIYVPKDEYAELLRLLRKVLNQPQKSLIRKKLWNDYERIQINRK